MNNDELEHQLEWAREKLREQGPLILFDPEKYKLEERLNCLLKRDHPEIHKQCQAADIELALFEAFSMIEEFKNGQHLPEEYIGTLLFSAYVLSNPGCASD